LVLATASFQAAATVGTLADFNGAWIGVHETGDTFAGTQTFASSDGFALHEAGTIRLFVLRNESAAPNRISFRQTVSVEAGQRYRSSVDARL
jgi:hypothetical protein